MTFEKKPTPTEIFESYKKILLSMKVLTGRIVFVSLLFFISALLGFFVANSNLAWTKEFVEALAENFVGLMGKSNSVLLFYIFINNLSVSLMLLLLFFLFGIAPILALLSNGLTIGILVAYSIDKIGLDNVFLAIAPHGIFEIPAFLIAATLSLHLSKKFFIFLRKQNSDFKQDFLFATKIMFLVVTPLLLIAAIIETFVTPLLLMPV
jgi:stage II sporulation protein M